MNFNTESTVTEYPKVKFPIHLLLFPPRFSFLFIILVATNTANSAFGPIMERRTKADRIRLTLNVLEQWKFFFNLPSSLQQHLRKVLFPISFQYFFFGFMINSQH